MENNYLRGYNKFHNKRGESMTRTFESDLERELRDPEFAKGFGASRANTSFALTLANARLNAGLTQKELALKEFQEGQRLDIASFKSTTACSIFDLVAHPSKTGHENVTPIILLSLWFFPVPVAPCVRL